VSQRALTHSDELDDGRLDPDITRYADDLTLLFPQTRMRGTPDADAADLARRRVLQIVDVRVPPYETEFEIHINRREASHVQES